MSSLTFDIYPVKLLLLAYLAVSSQTGVRELSISHLRSILLALPYPDATTLNDGKFTLKLVNYFGLREETLQQSQDGRRGCLSRQVQNNYS